MCMQKFHRNIPLRSRDRASFIFFSRIWSSAKLRPMKNVSSQSPGLVLLISMFTQKFIKIFHSFQEIGLFSLFQNLYLGNASANPKWYLTISWATSCQYQCVGKILTKYSIRFRIIDIYTNRSVTKSSQTVRWQNQMFNYRAPYESYGAREVTFQSFYYCVLSQYWFVLSNYYIVLSTYYCDISK